MGGWASLFGAVSNRLPNYVTQGAVATYFRVSAIRDVGFRGTHSIQTVQPGETMQVRVLPALSDNYMYLLVDQNTKEAAVVDPVDPEAVLKAVKEEGVKLTTILTTHHHWDHAGGNKGLLEKAVGLTVLGGDSRIDGVTRMVVDGDVASLGGLNIKCLATPCHTTGHICYYVTDAQTDEKIVFTGDTLFLGGCGRFFEGTAEQMYTALVEKLGALPSETKVYCGHEYSLQNLGFGSHVEPENQDIADKIQWCRTKRELTPAEPTIPSSIGEEKRINPFMRVEEGTVQAHTKTTGGIETMRALRAEKDNFKQK